MQAVRIHKTGGVEVLSLDSKLPIPKAGEGQLIVRVAYAGVNYIDTYFRTGSYKVPEMPYILGREGSGIVSEVGSGVTEHKVGDRVAFFVERAYAEYVVVPAARALPVPSGVSLATAGAIALQGLTAHYLTTTTYPIQKGDVVLVHAGAGGVGQLLIQMAKMRGARVLATVGSDDKIRICTELGADAVVNYKTADFVQRVAELTAPPPPKGSSSSSSDPSSAAALCNVVYDGVGKDTYMGSLKCLQPLGHLVLFGQSSGRVPPIDPMDLCNVGSITLTRPNLKDYVASSVVLQARWREVCGLLTATRDRLRLSISATIPLANVADAHTLLESRKSLGKILLEVAAKDIEKK